MSKNSETLFREDPKVWTSCNGSRYELLAGSGIMSNKAPKMFTLCIWSNFGVARTMRGSKSKQDLNEVRLTSFSVSGKIKACHSCIYITGLWQIYMYERLSLQAKEIVEVWKGRTVLSQCWIQRSSFQHAGEPKGFLCQTVFNNTWRAHGEN